MNLVLGMLQSGIGRPLPPEAPPVSRWLGSVVQAAEAGRVTVTLAVRPDQVNPGGVLHGGVAAALADDLIGMTVATLDLPAPYLSVNLSVDYLGRARPGDVLTATAQVVRAGRRVIHAVCEITGAEGALVAKASSNLVILIKE